MKNLIFSCAALILLLGLLSFTPSSHAPFLDISGKWKLQIDNTMDGKVSGHNGCDEMEFTTKGINNFIAKYSNCPSSNTAKPSQFSGKIYVTNRGNLINIIQDNLAGTQYYSAWSGKLYENGEILGIWTDVEGNQGEFRLSR